MTEAVIHELLAADSVCYTDAGPICGPDDFHAKQFVPFTAAFSELSLTVDGTVCEGDQVVVRWTASTGLPGGPSARGRRARYCLTACSAVVVARKISK